MKNTKLITFLVLFINLNLFSQEIITKFESVHLIKPRVVSLNGGMKSAAGGKSREYIKIDLPQNTVEWYYSFTTSQGVSGTKNLNLATQIAAMLASKTSVVGMALTTTGITKGIMKSIEIPAGTNSADIYLCDRANIEKFLAKEDLSLFGSSFSYTMEGTVQNTKQATVQINDIKRGTVFLGLKNPSAFDGININIEVVAIVKTQTISEKSDNEKKAELYGGLGWKQFQNGDYQKCIEYSDKANETFQLGWVNANKGLSLLLLNRETEAMDIYINAITLIKKQNNANSVFAEVINDLEKEINKNPNLMGAKEIKEIIQLELK
jgi:hypothetical protein